MKTPILIGAGALLVLISQAKLPIDSARAIIKQTDPSPFTEAEILGVIQTESSFKPFAVSSCLALGLMQVLYPTAKDMGLTGFPTALFDPDTNIHMGVKYLKWLYGILDSKDASFHAYNMGIGNYRQGKRNPAYVQRIKYYALQYS